MSIFSSLRKHAVISTVVVLAAIIIAIIAGRAATKKAPAANNDDVKQVELINATTFRQGSLAVSANGIVESHSQVDLKSQTSAPISTIDVSIGQTVNPGEVIMELQNSDIRAQLAQAEASLAAVQGQYQTGAFSVDSAKQGAIDKLRDAYNKTYNAVVTKAEVVLYNNDGNGGRLTTFSPDTALNSEMTATDIDLKTGLRQWKSANDALDAGTSTDAIETVIGIADMNMTRADTLLNDMSKILNNLAGFATPSFSVSLSNWNQIVSGAHDSVSGAEQALTAAEMALSTSNSSQSTTANAQVTAAQAGVNNLQAQLAKTIIRSPISGRVSVLPLREGELASPGTLLATVIGNDSGLRVKAYVSGDDLSRVTLGSSATIQNPTMPTNASSTSNAIKGVVSNIAPGVDPTTKKAEVDLDVSNSDKSGLVIGDNVTVAISVPSAPLASGSNRNQPTIYRLPIQDVKIVPGAAYVFTVGADSKIVRNDVVIGSIQCDFIEVTSGLSDTMDIVSPVYELDPGQQVKVQ